MRKISDIELYKVKKTFDRICDIIDIPKDAISFRQDEDSCGIYCDKEYFDVFFDFMMSLDGWETVEPEEESED